MDIIQFIAQAFGVAGLIISVCSFQAKKNKNFFVMQSLGGLMFFLNFILIGAVAAALFNLTNLVRGALMIRSDKKLWKIAVIQILYTACFVFSLTLIFENPFQIFLSALTLSAQLVMSMFMWLGNGRSIRIAQFAYASPAWLVHNIFNFSLGGLLCEVFNMLSIVVAFVRYGSDGFEK